MNPNDNINERYQAFEKKPGSMKKALAYFYNVTEDSFDAFREVVQNHTDIGKAAIVIMARNQASHLFKLANDEGKPKSDRIRDISAIIAPMFELFYDRLTHETIEGLEEKMEGEEE